MNKNIKIAMSSTLLIALIAFVSLKVFAVELPTVFSFSAKTIDGEEKKLNDYKGKVLLIVNVASKCGFTPQYKGLQELYAKYKDQGFEILAFPCNQFRNQEPGTPEEIKKFCTENYGVTFQLFDKIDVNGDNAHELYKYLTTVSGSEQPIQWNFTKFLINKEGKVYSRYSHDTEPERIARELEELLKSE